MSSPSSNNQTTDFNNFSWSGGKSDTKKKEVNNSSDFNSFSWSGKHTFTPSHIKVGTSLGERLTGAPTKQTDGTYTPNTGVLPFLGSIPKATLETAKTFLPGIIPTGKTLGQSIATNTGAFDALNKANQQTDDLKLKLAKRIIVDNKAGKDTTNLMKAYNGLSSRTPDTIQSLAPNTTKTNLQALGDVLLMGSGLIMPGEAGVGGTAGKLLSRSVIENFIKDKTVSETEKLMAKKLLFNLGTGYGFDVGNNLAEGKKGTKALQPGAATLLNTVFTGAEARGLLKTARKSEASILEQRALKRANFGKIPEAGVTPPGYFDKSLKELKAPIAENVEKIKIPKIKVENAPKNTSLNIGLDVGKKKNAITEQMIRKELKKFNIDIKKIEYKKSGTELTAIPILSRELTPEELGQLSIDLKQGAIPQLSYGVGIMNGPKLKDWGGKFKESEYIKPSDTDILNKENKILTETKTKIKEKPVNVTEEEVTKGVQTISDNLPRKVREHINLKEESKTANEFIKKNGVDDSISALESGKDLPNDMRKDSLYSVLTNNKSLTKDQMDRLFAVRKEIPSLSAQNLGLNRLQDRESPYAVIENIKNTLENKQPYFLKVNKKIKTKSIAKQITDLVKSYEGDVSVIRSVIKELIC